MESYTYVYAHMSPFFTEASSRRENDITTTSMTITEQHQQSNNKLYSKMLLLRWVIFRSSSHSTCLSLCFSVQLRMLQIPPKLLVQPSKVDKYKWHSLLSLSQKRFVCSIYLYYRDTDSCCRYIMSSLPTYTARCIIIILLFFFIVLFFYPVKPTFAWK